MIIFVRMLILMLCLQLDLCFSMSSLDDGYIRHHRNKVEQLYDECVGTNLPKKLQEFVNADLQKIRDELCELACCLRKFEENKKHLENLTTGDPRIIDAAMNKVNMFILRVSDKIMSKNVLSFYNNLPEDTRLVIAQYVPVN